MARQQLHGLLQAFAARGIGELGPEDISGGGLSLMAWHDTFDETSRTWACSRMLHIITESFTATGMGVSKGAAREQVAEGLLKGIRASPLMQLLDDSKEKDPVLTVNQIVFLASDWANFIMHKEGGPVLTKKKWGEVVGLLNNVHMASGWSPPRFGTPSAGACPADKDGVDAHSVASSCSWVGDEMGPSCLPAKEVAAPAPPPSAACLGECPTTSFVVADEPTLAQTVSWDAGPDLIMCTECHGTYEKTADYVHHFQEKHFDPSGRAAGYDARLSKSMARVLRYTMSGSALPTITHLANMLRVEERDVYKVVCNSTRDVATPRFFVTNRLPRRVGATDRVHAYLPPLGNYW